MSYATVVSEDAERLVREGGVVNRPYPFPKRLGDLPKRAWVWSPQNDFGGKASVTDVHHADDCVHNSDQEYWVVDEYCHPDAKPDEWHWVIGQREGA